MAIQRYYWTEDFDEESFDEFIQFQNELPDGTPFEVWLDCNGGNCMIAEMLKELFESYPEEDFQLVGCGKLCSAALDLFVTTQCKKYLIPGTIGMAHTISRKVYVNGKGELKMRFSEEKIMQNIYPMVEEFESRLPAVIGDEAMRQYLNNEDVWISTSEIQKFLT